MAEKGTLEIVLVAVGNLLEPLTTELRPERSVATLAELGIVVTQAQADTLAGPIASLVASASQIVEAVSNLVSAIDTDDRGEIVAISAELIGLVPVAIERIDDLQGSVAGLAGLPGSVTGAFAERLFNFLAVRALDQARGVNEILELLGVLVRERNNVGSVDPDNPPHTVSTFIPARIGDWLGSPQQVLQDEFDWGSAGFTGIELLTRVERLLISLGALAFFDDSGAEPTLDFMPFQLRSRTDLSPRGVTLQVRQDLNPGKITLATADVAIEFETDVQLPFDTGITIQSPSQVSLDLPDGLSLPSGTFSLRFIADRSQAASGFRIIDEGAGSLLEVAKFAVSLDTTVGSSGVSGFAIGGELSGGHLLVSLENADGFLADIFGGIRLESDFDLGFGYSSDEGLYFIGSSGLEIQLPLHIDLGVVEVNALALGVGVDGGSFPTSIGADIRALLGPLTAVVEGIGLEVDFELTQDRDGNAGPVDVRLGFKPPQGVGLAVDAVVVKGGGYLYFDREKEEYAGALELVFSEILTLKAVGLITTRMPNGESGFSLLCIISAEFGTPFQLGFGFTLNAVGGLLGLNRTMHLEAIALGVRTGAIESVMFPDDLIANAPRIISDLGEFFPPLQGTFLVGPMAKIGWGTPTLVTVSLGVIVEVPPGNVAILGVLKLALPHEDAALIVIQVNFIGALEVDKNRLWFFAELFESRVLFITLEGGMGLLFDWGENPNFVFSVGGFHPEFSPPPLPFPVPNRLTFSLLNESFARIQVTGYFAVTSNTAQFGAGVNVFFGLSEFGIEGHLSFDALFRFSPFSFVITISASLDVKVFGIGLFSVHMRGRLEGTSPWHIEGEGSISLLFFDIDVPFSHTWGEDADTLLAPIDVLPILEAEFEKAENWVASIPTGNSLLVTLRETEESDELVMHPVGQLQISQRAVPLGIELEKIGNQTPRDVTRVSVDLVDPDLAVIEPTTEKFAVAQFKDLTDAQKLSSPAYEDFDTGLVCSAQGRQSRFSSAIKRVMRYEEIIVDSGNRRTALRFVDYAIERFMLFIQGNAASASSLSLAHEKRRVPVPQKVLVKSAGFAVASRIDNSAIGAELTFVSHTEAQEYLQSVAASAASGFDELHVVPTAELREPA